MAKGEQLAAPMMGRCTCFHPDQAQRQRGKELQNLSAPKLSADQHCAISIGSVDLKYVCRQITSDDHNFLLHGSTPRRGSTTTSLHSYAGAEVVHPITSQINTRSIPGTILRTASRHRLRAFWVHSLSASSAVLRPPMWRGRRRLALALGCAAPCDRWLPRLRR